MIISSVGSPFWVLFLFFRKKIIGKLSSNFVITDIEDFMFGLKSQNSFSEHFGHRIAYSWWTLFILALDVFISNSDKIQPSFEVEEVKLVRKPGIALIREPEMGFWSELR